LLLIGQSVRAIDSYFDATVTAPGGVATDMSFQLDGLEELNYLAGKYPKSTLSVGVDLQGVIDDVAAGKSDVKIDVLLDTLTAYDHPVFLRLGYHFNDPANNYDPKVYVSVWKKFHERLQARGSQNVALVWDSALGCGESGGGYSLADWYPGDDLVDWIGTAYSECTDPVIQFAHEHHRPVMIQAASQGVNWEESYAPLFKFVQDHNDVVRALVYVNEGDGHIGLNDELVKRWKNETKQSFWLRGGPELFNTLGFVE
jgi:hypothetical protein